MIDDPLERALRALPLEEPPAGMRESILAATVLRNTPSIFCAWEVWTIGTVLAAIALLIASFVATPGPTGERVGSAFVEVVYRCGFFQAATYAWLAVGASAVWAISSLPLMPRSQRPEYNH